MKILYAIQGTGNGHLARAEDVVPVLRNYGELDLFVSGAQADIGLIYPVKYISKGLSFYFGKKGGVDLLKTFRKTNTRFLYQEVRKFPVENYDLVVNDFEPISAWACRLKRIPCVALSHQSALLSPKVVKPRAFDPVGEWILKHYAPADHHTGFHFDRFDRNVFTPVIRGRIRQAKVCDNGHYTVYLPAYDDRKLVPLLSRFPYVRWHVFSKHTTKAYHFDKVSVFPVSNDDFTVSMTTSRGVLCGAGFETPAEALYLGKKLMVIPMKNQYEQQYNAAALKKMGITVLKKLRKKNLRKVESWIDDDRRVNVTYDDTTQEAVECALTALK